MSWDEFADLLTGLNESTPLVRVAQIRTERDPEVVRRLTVEQRAMRAEWQRRRAKARTDKETSDYIALMQQAFARAFG